MIATRGVSVQTDTISKVEQLDPLADPRWEALVQRHPLATIFHTPAWLQALRQTYGFEPAIISTSGNEQNLADGLPFCRVRSWLTGNRLISVPFADHCDPLVDNAETLATLLAALAEEARDHRWNTAEIRPLSNAVYGMMPSSFGESSEYVFHSLDLSQDENALYEGMHKSCVQRKIRRGEKELTYEGGRSERLLQSFYRLLLLTRRRHQLPPQPIFWFRNLIECLGENACIHVAMKNEQPVASIFTLSFRKTMVYKYGCSDSRFHNLGGMPFLFWNAIRVAKRAGQETLDLGRSDTEQAGLIEFKEHLGATRSTLKYFSLAGTLKQEKRRGSKLGGGIVSRMPDALLKIAGRVLYRHFA